MAEAAAGIPLTPGSHSYGEALWWLGLSELGEGNVKVAKANFKDYRKISKAAGYSPGLARAAYGLGWLCAHQNKWVEALRWLGEAAQHYEGLRCNPALICADLGRAIIHARMGKMGNAELALSRARMILGEFPWSIRDREWGKAVTELKNLTRLVGFKEDKKFDSFLEPGNIA